MTDPTIRERLRELAADPFKADYGAHVRVRQAELLALLDELETLERRATDLNTALTDLVGDHEIHPAFMPDCSACIALYPVPSRKPVRRSGPMSKPVNQYDPRHPHEPAIPPAIDPEGRCLVCGLMVERDVERARLAVLTEALRRAAEGQHDFALTDPDVGGEHSSTPWTTCPSPACSDARAALANLPVERVAPSLDAAKLARAMWMERSGSPDALDVEAAPFLPRARAIAAAYASLTETTEAET